MGKRSQAGLTLKVGFAEILAMFTPTTTLFLSGQTHTGRRRNYKLIVDPEIHGKQYEKQYRFDGHAKGVRGPHLGRETPIAYKFFVWFRAAPLS